MLLLYSGSEGDSLYSFIIELDLKKDFDSYSEGNDQLKEDVSHYSKMQQSTLGISTLI